MNDRLAALESAIHELRSSVGQLEARIAHLEGQAPSAVEAAPGAGAGALESAAAGTAPASRGWRDPIALLSLIGRLFIVLGGAYLLRAMTDTGAIPPAGGVALGLAYGLVWLALADRAAGRGQRPGAVFHGLGAAMVAFPVVFEATTHFRVFPGASSAAALAVLTAGLLVVAWRRRLQALAWIAVAVAIPTSVVILAKTGVVVPHAYFLISVRRGDAVDGLFARLAAGAVARRGRG